MFTLMQINTPPTGRHEGTKSFAEMPRSSSRRQRLEPDRGYLRVFVLFSVLLLLLLLLYACHILTVHAKCKHPPSSSTPVNLL